MEPPKQSNAIARSPLKLLNGSLPTAPKPSNVHPGARLDGKNKAALLPSSALELRLGTSLPPDRRLVPPNSFPANVQLGSSMDTQVNMAYVDSKGQPRLRRAKQPTVIVKPPPMVDDGAKVVVRESGILSPLNPGIIRRVRDKEEVHASIRAIISGNGSRKRSREEDPGRTLTLALPCKEVKNDDESSESLSLEGMFMKEEEGNSSGATETSSRDEKVVAPITRVGSQQLTNSDLARVWFKLLTQDLKGRISALKRSRRRVRTAIVAKDESMFLPWNHPSFQQSQSENVDPAKLKRQYDMQVDKWKSLFVNMDAALGAEASTLETHLKKVQELEVTSTTCICNAPGWRN